MIQINPIILFIIIFIVAYHLITIQDSYKILMVVLCLGIAGYYYWYSSLDTQKREQTSNELLDKLEKKITQEVANHNIYYVHRSLPAIKYIRRNKHVVQFISDLNFLEIYHKDAYYKLIAYLEHFFRLHFNVMIGKYDACTNLPILKEIRVEILNIMASLTFNLPYQSTIIDIGNDNMDDYIQKKTRDIDAILYKNIKIAFHKYETKTDCKHLSYKYPVACDTLMDPHVLFV